jgi:hypothetical protein
MDWKIYECKFLPDFKLPSHCLREEFEKEYEKLNENARRDSNRGLSAYKADLPYDMLMLV